MLGTTNCRTPSIPGLSASLTRAESSRWSSASPTEPERIISSVEVVEDPVVVVEEREVPVVADALRRRLGADDHVGVLRSRRRKAVSWLRWAMNAGEARWSCLEGTSPKVRLDRQVRPHGDARAPRDPARGASARPAAPPARSPPMTPASGLAMVMPACGFIVRARAASGLRRRTAPVVAALRARRAALRSSSARRASATSRRAVSSSSALTVSRLNAAWSRRKTWEALRTRASGSASARRARWRRRCPARPARR